MEFIFGVLGGLLGGTGVRYIWAIAERRRRKVHLATVLLHESLASLERFSRVIPDLEMEKSDCTFESVRRLVSSVVVVPPSPELRELLWLLDGMPETREFLLFLDQWDRFERIQSQYSDLHRTLLTTVSDDDVCPELVEEYWKQLHEARLFMLELANSICRRACFFTRLIARRYIGGRGEKSVLTLTFGLWRSWDECDANQIEYERRSQSAFEARAALSCPPTAVQAGVESK